MKKRTYPTNLTVRVKCSMNAFHKISINERGQLVFHNHTHEQFGRLPGWRELGGKPMGCYQFLERWQEALQTGKDSRLPSSILPFFRECREYQAVREAPNKEKLSGTEFPFPSVTDLWVAEDPHPRALANVLNRLLHSQCGMPDQEWVRVLPLNSDYYLLAILRPYPVKSAGPVVTTVPVDWYRRVARRGLAFIEDGITLDADPVVVKLNGDPVWKLVQLVQLLPYCTRRNRWSVGVRKLITGDRERETVSAPVMAGTSGYSQQSK